MRKTKNSINLHYWENYTEQNANKLQNVDVYRSDGIISYTKSEVESDKKLANYLGIPLVRIVVISKDKLLDNNTLFSYEAKGDSIFVNQAKNLVIYVNSIQK